MAQLGQPAGFSLSLQDNDQPLEIGGTDTDPGVDHTPPAWLDDVRIYNTLLSATQLDTVRQQNLGTSADSGDNGLLANDTDANGDPLTAVVLTQPAHGTLVFNSNGSFIYTPSPTYTGTDQFTYEATDGALYSKPATVSIRVNATGLPPLAVNSVRITEGNSGTKNLVFTVTQYAGEDHTVTVKYATSDGTATVAGNDYVATSGTLTIPARSTSGTFSVPIVGDTVSEPDEYFNVLLSSPTNAVINGGAGTGTIRNDDNSVSINNVTQYGGTSGTTPFTFTVTLSPAAAFAVTVQYATADGTAKAASGDYVPVKGTLTFQPGQASLPVTVTVNGSSTRVTNKTFYLDLTGSTNAFIVQVTGTGKILPGSAPALALAPPPGGPRVASNSGPLLRYATARPADQPDLGRLRARGSRSNGGTTAC